MGAGHGQHVAARQHVLGQPLRAAGVGQAGVEDRLHQRVAAREHIADHVQIGADRQLFGVEALDQLDALGFELGAHRRVDVGIRAFHVQPELARQRGNAAHEGAADAENMNV